MTLSAEHLIDDHAIRQVLYRYCRGVDRRDFELIRSCYHPDATCDHGTYRGDLDGFMSYLQGELPRFESTMHMLGNVLIDLDGDRARSEAYALAFHRLAATPTKPERDFVVGFRYLDDLVRSEAGWLISRRRCIFSSGRLDPVALGFAFGSTHLMGASYPHDPVYEPGP
jgi:hypothetical protein